MSISKNALFALFGGCATLSLLFNAAHLHVWYIPICLACFTYLLLPGILLSLILRISALSFWEHLLFVVGLSIAFLEFGGLLINVLGPAFGVNDPLAFDTLLSGFALLTTLLLAVAWVRTPPDAIHIQLAIPSSTVQVLFLVPVFLPLLAAEGAILLNNGESNMLTLILLGTIACYSLLLVLLRHKIPLSLYPFTLFFIGMALLFTTSLRSWYISGHDIEREMYVFQLTNTHHFWNMAWYRDAYNACLSITILPTILTNLLPLQDMYVFKVIFQIIFAFAPVAVFFIINTYTKPVIAFLSAFFFLSFPTFFNDMPMLNRQEIGFLFFGLALYMMVKRNWKRQFYVRETVLVEELSLPMRRILFGICILGVVVSHYSTNFVDVILVTFVYVGNRLLSLSAVKRVLVRLVRKSRLPVQTTFANKAFLNLPLLILLVGGTYAWNSLYTQSSDHAGSVAAEVVSSLLLTSRNTRSSDLSYSIFFATKSDPKAQLQDYIQGIVQSARAGQGGTTSQFYSPALTGTYPVVPMQQEILAPTPLGELLESFHVPVFALQSSLRSLSATGMQLFVVLGLCVILFSKHKRLFDVQYMLLCVGAVFLLILEILLPALSVEYGLLRMFLQFLFLFSLPIVLSVQSLFFFLKDHQRILCTGIVAVLFFLNLTGVVSHLTGNYYPQLPLDNAGLYYDAYYVHTSDVLAITWLVHHNPNHDPVEADLSGTNKLLTYGGIEAFNEIFPQVIHKNAYVYQEISSRMVVSIDRDVLIYNSSKPFLDENKNLIYSNGRNNIYR
ncbi:hypothetical protein KSF_085740 [Reticulibacter mediterranei]|uniref:DUF2206 domain-containing protein n=1 Tax=Reticulibacter mediterranei TaxID=2778369 RepID=A0A8J3J0C4_9CHLR|nr:DUF2206 domain-containing protein [Reticulibacter mediterranei]GHO98526.1 hypothetical protein KSF_085740 [Reticulibacter mediterranei]